MPKYDLYTINELLQEMWLDVIEHHDCDCRVCLTIETVLEYADARI